MESRFTVKDFIQFLAVAVVGVLVLLAIYQVDRQWDKLAVMERRLGEQGEDLRQLRKLETMAEQNQANQQALATMDVRLEQQSADLREIRAVITGAQAQGKVVSVAPVQAPAATPEPAANNNKPKAAVKSAVPPAFKRAHLATQAADYAEGDQRVFVMAAEVPTLTPLVSGTADATAVESYVLESLIMRDPDTLKHYGVLAEDDWQVSDDGLRFTFRLRNAAKFSDGKPVTAADVVFTYELVMNPKINTPRYRAYFSKIKAVEALDERTVQFTFAEPYFQSLELAGGLPVLAKHFYGKYMEDTQAFNESKGLLFGSGPYRLADPENWAPGNGLIELERNPRYWGAVQPSFDKLSWKVIANAAGRLASFRNRDVDIYGARPLEYQSLLKDEQIKKQADNFEYMPSTVGYSYVGWNQQRAGKATIFADVRVRQAMTYLTNKQAIIDEIMLGYAEPAVSPFSPRSKQHNKDETPWAYDPAKAKALLAEAGFADTDGDGVLEKDGKPLEFKLTFYGPSEDTKRIVLYLKDAYARAGVALIPDPSEWSVMVDKLKKKDFDAITLGWTSGVETDIYQIFHSSQIGDQGDNATSYSNPELDKLIDQARAEVNEAKRMPLWQQAEKHLINDQPYTFLMRRKTLAFFDKRFRNVEITPLGANAKFVPVEWYVPKAEQRY